MRTLLLLVLLLFSGAAFGQDWDWLNQLRTTGREHVSKGRFDQAHAAFIELGRCAKQNQANFFLADVLFDLATLHANKAYRAAQPQFIEQLLIASANAAAKVDYLQKEYDAVKALNSHLRALKKPVDNLLLADIALSFALSQAWWLSYNVDAQDAVAAHGLLGRLDEWAALGRKMNAGNTADATKAALAFIERLEKDKYPRAAARARLWVAQQLCKPDHAGKGGEVSVLKLAQAAIEQFEKTAHQPPEFFARQIAAKAETDISKALVHALRAWELSKLASQGDNDLVLELLELLIRIAPVDSRATWKSEFVETLVRRVHDGQTTLLACLRGGNDTSSYWVTATAKMRGYVSLDARIARAVTEMERLIERLRQLDSPPTAAQRAAFKAKVEAHKKDKAELAALARMAELAGRYEIIDLLFENLASEEPLQECALALETLARREDLPRLVKLAASPNSMVATCAAAMIFRFVNEGASVDLKSLLELPKLDALACVWLLAAQAARGDEASVAKLRLLGAKADEAGNTALLALAALGDATSLVELRRRLPPDSNAAFYGRNLARLPLTHLRAAMQAMGTETVEGARAHWAHREWRTYTRSTGPVIGPRLLYLKRRDRKESLETDSKILDDLKAARDEATGSFHDAEAVLYDWAIKHAMQDDPENAADFRYEPDGFLEGAELQSAGAAELDRAPGAATPSSDGCWLTHSEGERDLTLSLHKRLSDCTLADNRITLRISDLGRRLSFNKDDAFVRKIAAALDKLYESAELRIPGKPAVKLSIAFKGYSWRDEQKFLKDGVNVPAKVTSLVNPERWGNKENDGVVTFSGELPRDEIGDPLPLDLLAQSELVVKVKLFASPAELKFRLSPIRESMADKPDLVVGSFTIEPANPKPGQVLVATLITVNAGRSVTKAGLCTVRFYVKNPQYEQGFRVVAEQQFDPVGWRHGETKKFTLLPVLCETHFLNTYSHTFVPEAGDVELKVMVDSFDMVEESDNENNISGRTLGWKIEGERAAALAEADLLAAVQPMLDRLRLATTTVDCLAISASIETLFERAQVKTQNIRGSLDLCRRVGCAVSYDIDVAAIKRDLAEVIQSGALTPAVLERMGSRLASAQRAYVMSGAPLVMTDLDRARRTTLALSRSAKLTNEAVELGSMLGLTPEGTELPKGAGTVADSLDKIDNALSLARWIDDLRRRNQGDTTVKPNTKDAVDAVTSLTGLDALLHVPKTIFKNFIDYGDRAFNNCSKVLELINKRISGESTDAEITAAIAELKAGMAPAQLGRDIIKDLGVDSLKKVKVIGPIIDFFVTWFEEDERYKPN